MSKNRGVALITAVMVSMFLLVVGMAFLYFVERDSYLQLKADRQAKAHHLARAGIEYFAYCRAVQVGSLGASGEPAPFGAGETRTIQLGPNEFVEITADSTRRGCRALGYITSSTGSKTAEAVLGLFLPIYGVLSKLGL